jgi:butyryl-CoA dehydrogenase
MQEGFLKLTETQIEIRNAVREFAQSILAKTAGKVDEEGKPSLDTLKRMAELGFLGIPISEKYGGLGLDTLCFVLALEELAKVCPSTTLTVAAHTTLATLPIYLFGNEEQKTKYVIPQAQGRKIGCFCSTEPNIGSDVAGAQTTAQKVNGGYRLRGSKMFATNASFADTFIVSAVTDRDADRHKRLSVFIVEKDFGGIVIAKEEDKLGMRGSATCVVNFDDTPVPAENLLGKESEGFLSFAKTLDVGRIGISAISIGIAEGAFEKAVAYAEQRKQFDKAISSFQAIRFMIADMATEIEAARLLTWQAALLKEQGLPFSKEASMAKLFSSEMAMRATRNCIQILGGYGYMSEYEVERYYRDAKLTEIGEGTSEIQRLVIARHILGKM